jgi:hypothetical protein
MAEVRLALYINILYADIFIERFNYFMYVNAPIDTGMIIMNRTQIFKSERPAKPIDDLLQTRLCDIDLSLRHSGLQSQVDIFLQELKDRGLKKLKPDIYLGDEWFSPRGVVAIAVPFYLADPRLIELERKMMTQVEGETKDWFRKLIRHEAGHCFDHAYRLSQTKRWRQLFGNPDEAYNPDDYQPRPFSRKYVKNLADHYAQAHPIEDFAETFAVWMRGPDFWQGRYRLRPKVLEKLTYVDAMAKKYSNVAPLTTEKSRMCSARRLRITLRTYYERRIAAEGERHGKIADRRLKKIFHDPRPHAKPANTGAKRNGKNQGRFTLETVTRH